MFFGFRLKIKKSMCFFGFLLKIQKTHGFFDFQQKSKKHMAIQNFQKFFVRPIVLEIVDFSEILDLETVPQKTPLEIQEKPQFLLYDFREVRIEKLIGKLRKLAKSRRSLIPNMLPYMICISSLLKS